MAHVEPEDQRNFAAEVAAQLRAKGFTALWAGGCVRDALLGLAPKDYDVATNATPDQIREVFSRRRTLAIGAAFGVITVVGKPHEGQIDVATFRRDTTYSDGRRPDSVIFSSPEEDASRRDFTINGLFFDPASEEVIDYVGGQEDLAHGIVRAIGDAELRIEEDKLRMLRGVRFTAAYGFTLEGATLDAIRRRAGTIHVVSAERIAAEMRRMLCHPSRAEAVELLLTAGLLTEILPELTDIVADRPPGAWRETLRVLQTLHEPSLSLALAVLVHRAGTGELGEAITRRWRLPNREVQLSIWLLESIGSVRIAEGLPWSKLQPLFIQPGIQELLAFEAALMPGDNPGFARCQALAAQSPEILNPPWLLTGDDLVKVGVPPGPDMGNLLAEVRAAQLDGQLHTTAEAVEWVVRQRADAQSDSEPGIPMQ